MHRYLTSLLPVYRRLLTARLGAPVVALLASLAVGSVFIVAAGANPWQAYGALLRAGFGCRGPGGLCALLTALQYATPLILSGLSATLAFRAGLFSIGQAGQMVVGAGAATWLAGNLPLPGLLYPAVALAGGVVAGACWGFIPGVLKARLNIHEVIVTLLLNPIALAVVGAVGWQRIPEAARLAPLVAGTKLNSGLIIALAAAALVFVHLWWSAAGYEARMAGQADLFARFGGVRSGRVIVRAMALSGAMAGLAGAIEVLGVHYRFVASFSAVDQFDGIVVALLGQLHPLGVALSALLLGGIRLGAINGLQLQAAVPRELGSALIALIVLFISMRYLSGSASRIIIPPKDF